METTATGAGCGEAAGSGGGATRRDLRLTSTVRSVSVLAQALLVAGVGPDGRPGVRVLVDQVLHTFPAAEPKREPPT